MLEIIRSSNPSNLNPIQISIHYTESGFHSLHSVNVIDFDNTLQDIKIINPWGREEIIDLEIIKSRISFIISYYGCDKRIPRVPKQFFSPSLQSYKLPWYQLLFITKKTQINFPDDKLKKYLDCLTLDQKIDLIIQFYSNKISKKEKVLILKILSNILQGSQFQNKTVLVNLYNKLSIKNIALFCFIDSLKINNFIFDDIVQKITCANYQWGKILKEIIENDLEEDTIYSV
jgi:hypothetical protein